VRRQEGKIASVKNNADSLEHLQQIGESRLYLEMAEKAIGFGFWTI
jgi:hypothetical protein